MIYGPHISFLHRNFSWALTLIILLMWTAVAQDLKSYHPLPEENLHPGVLRLTGGPNETCETVKSVLVGMVPVMGLLRESSDAIKTGIMALAAHLTCHNLQTPMRWLDLYRIITNTKSNFRFTFGCCEGDESSIGCRVSHGCCRKSPGSPGCLYTFPCCAGGPQVQTLIVLLKISIKFLKSGYWLP